MQRLLHKDQWTKVLKEYITFSLCTCTRKKFGAIVQTNVESITENFANSGAAMSSMLIVLQKSISPTLVEEILKLEAFRDIKQFYCIYNFYWISNGHKVFEGCINNASCCICGKRNRFGSYQLCYN